MKFNFALSRIHVFLIGENYGMEIIESRHDNARKAGRSTLRQKLICRVRERRDAPRRAAPRCLLISSSAAHERTTGFLGRRAIPGVCASRGTNRSDRESGWHTGERDYAKDETTGRHDPSHHSIESYVRMAFT